MTRIKTRVKKETHNKKNQSVNIKQRQSIKLSQYNSNQE